jgi:ABC-type polysaccharide/polyol phosphate export permease
MSRGRLFGYLPYQLGDYLLQRASIAVVLVLFVAGIPLFGTMHGNPGFFGGPQGPSVAKQLFTGVVALFLPVGAFLAGAGIISGDRHHGYTRFYFSKPVNVVAYYVQTYLLHGVVFVALFGAITWGYGAVTVHQPVLPAMAAAGLTFVLVGGVGLLLSTLTRFDGALLALVYVVAMTMQQVAAMPGRPQLPAWVVQVARVLPPAYRLDQLRSQLYSAEMVDTAQLWHVIGYGLGAFLLGLMALRRLPLSR